jgi:predicted molibdopterin-dependent oxidoreductase YjgC
MFRRHPDAGLRITLDFEGRPVRASPGDTVAAALIGAGVGAFGESAGGEPRAPYCLIGHCFGCLLEIDGRPGRQACLVEARDGMRVRRPEARP